MTAGWEGVFDAYGVKRVSKNDKDKSAYVLNKDQLRVVEMAGISPATVKPGPGFNVNVLLDEAVQFVEATYYHAERKGSGRPVEPRMGRAFITSWLNTGDRVLLGCVGSQLFAVKLPAGAIDEESCVRSVVARVDRQAVLDRARKASGKPAKRIARREDFMRDPWVVQAAILRANGRCEMPGCSSELFRRADGSVYLEVHHVFPLGEGGEDSLENVAALCPRCHRELHSGEHRIIKRTRLSAFLWEVRSQMN